MKSEKQEGERPEVAAASEMSAGLGGVLVYRTRGSNRACGQTIGANGAGEFAVLLRGTPEACSTHARRHIASLEALGHKIEEAMFVPNSEEAGYFGNPVIMVDA